jgi:hypothetical protein
MLWSAVFSPDGTRIITASAEKRQRRDEGGAKSDTIG